MATPTQQLDQPGHVRPDGGSSLEDVLRRCLRAAPVSWALPRVQESLLLSRVDLPKPVLDLGCGDGLFASFADGMVGAIGLDHGAREVGRAMARRLYRAVLRADTSHLPFATGTLGAVVSISTLEHLRDLDQVLAEVARVLRDDGLFVCSVPGPGFGAALFWPKLFQRLRCDLAARAYVGFVDRVFRHRNLLSVEEWRGHLRRHGLALTEVHRFNPPRAAAWQDLFYGPSAFAAGLRRLAGRWILWSTGRRAPAAMLARLTIPSLERRESAGTCFFFRVEPRRNGSS